MSTPAAAVTSAAPSASATNTPAATTANTGTAGTNDGGKVTAYTPAARQSARSQALAEAESVLLSPGCAGLKGGTAEELDGFNLLSVVSNPRSGAPPNVHLHLSPGSRHGAPAADGAGAAGASNPTGTATPAASAAPPTAQTVVSATDVSALYRDVEETITEGLHDLSATINTVNSYVSTLSSYYLGSTLLLPSATEDYYGELEYEGLVDDVMAAQLSPEELREELRRVDVADVERYLRQCGGLAWRFDARRGESELINVGDGVGGGGGTSGTNPNASAKNLGGEMDLEREEEEKKEQDSGSNGNNSRGMQQQEEEDDDDDPTRGVPEIFFSPYFDLTDPHTFESLLVMDQEEEEEEGRIPKESSSDRSSTDAAPTPTLLTIHPTESLSGHLDTIELSLLNQVRSKSSSFFRETNRFSYLQNQVAECVAEVRSLRAALADVRERTVTDVELIPLMDRKRVELRLLGAVLDEVQDVVEVKGSVSGLIAAGDYGGAVGAIRNARALLRGDGRRKRAEEAKDDVVDLGSMTPAERAEREAAEAALNFPLSRLASMAKVDDQLNQYEELVVNDLANELVETFLSWEDGSAPSSSSSASSTSLLSGAFSLGGGVGRRSRTREIVHALSLCQKLGYAADRYRSKLSDVVRVTVRTTVTECAADALAELERTKSSKRISATATEGGGAAEDAAKPAQGKSSVTAGVTSMTFEQFLSCLDMLFDQILSLLKGAVGVTKFLREEGIVLKDEDPSAADTNEAAQKGSGAGKAPTTALSAAADLSHKSISELLRLRKESHSLITFNEMKRLWDTCLSFTLSIEKFSGQKAYGLRSTLLTQAKAFVERRHEANMASLVSALDGERWNQCDVSSERQASLERLCSGRAVLSGQGTIDVITGAPSANNAAAARPEGSKLAEADVEGKRYKVVWSCLLLVEMIMSNIACAAHFQTLATNVVGKVCELLRLFNSRTTQLVLGAGAIHSAARLKSINAKHLSLVTQCLGLVATILPHVRAALMAQLPAKQHGLLLELDKIKKEYGEHNEKVLAKLVSIIGGIIERGLAPRIAKIDFDARAKSMPTPSIGEVNDANYENSVNCCQFLDGISVNAKKMHQVLVALLPPEDLIDVFSRIFAYVDTKVPALFLAAVAEGEKQTVAAAKAAAEAASQRAQQGGTVVALPPQPGPSFRMPKMQEGKLRMILEVDSMCKTLNRLPNVQPWDFTAVRVLERELEVDFNLYSGPSAGGSTNAVETPSSSDASPVQEEPSEQAAANTAAGEARPEDQAVPLNQESMPTHSKDGDGLLPALDSADVNEAADMQGEQSNGLKNVTQESSLSEANITQESPLSEENSKEAEANSKEEVSTDNPLGMDAAVVPPPKHDSSQDIMTSTASSAAGGAADHLATIAPVETPIADDSKEIGGTTWQ